MSDGTKIEWTEATWNPITGCSVTSPGCTNCYAMKLAGTRLRHHESRAGLTQDSKAGPVWTGEVRLNEQWLDQPLRWKRPRKIFVCAHGDLFHESVPDEWIDRVFAVMALCPQHTFQVLTKRSARMREYFADDESRDRIDSEMGILIAQRVDPHVRRSDDLRATAPCLDETWPLPNVWLGVSVEDQQRADERIPDLLATPAAVRWLSCEPLLGPANLEPWLAPDKACQGCDDGEGYGNRCSSNRAPREEQCPWNRAVQTVVEHGPYDHDGIPAAITSDVHCLDWIVVGGESGPGARPMHPDWARSLRDQCDIADMPFFFKQWGEWLPWEPYQAPQWQAQNGQHEDSHILLPSDMDADPTWDDGLWAMRDRCVHFAFQRVGKKRAGRTLDGIIHAGLPSSPA